MKIRQPLVSSSPDACDVQLFDGEHRPTGLVPLRRDVAERWLASDDPRKVVYALLRLSLKGPDYSLDEIEIYMKTDRRRYMGAHSDSALLRAAP